MKLTVYNANLLTDWSLLKKLVTEYGDKQSTDIICKSPTEELKASIHRTKGGTTVITLKENSDERTEKEG
jgi:hypothetical protein